MSDPQSQWAQLLLSSLVEAGVRRAVISPGSRSTPLVWAALRTPGLTCHSIIDERSAGFFALGQARISGMPSLLICTSGTALSHYFPAVIEARESGMPVIVLSADRPFELSHSGAHQTIDQVRLFGSYAAYHELGTPVADRGAMLGLRRVAWQAVDEALTAPRGAVHLNFRAKKPLEPRVPFEAPDIALGSPRVPPRGSGVSAVDQEELDWVVNALHASECPLLVCGALPVWQAPPAELVRRFAELSGAVVCPEGVSPLRYQLSSEPAAASVICDTYDWLLDHQGLAQRLRPDFVLQLGGAPVSAALGRMLEHGALHLRHAVCADAGWPDPLHQAAQIVRARPTLLLEALTERLARRPRPHRPRLALWERAQRLARATIRARESELGEPAAVALICKSLPRGSVLALGNSLPPRLVDRYVPARDLGIDVCCQRGASGIEGAIAGALGAASAAGRTTTLLLGDVSFLHDVGSLWAARAEHSLAEQGRHPIVIVVLNNGGGRIFEALPIAREASVDLRFWTTPHRLSFHSAAELYGIAYARAESQLELARELAAAYERAGVTLVEVVLPPSSAADAVRLLGAALDPELQRLAEAP